MVTDPTCTIKVRKIHILLCKMHGSLLFNERTNSSQSIDKMGIFEKTQVCHVIEERKSLDNKIINQFVDNIRDIHRGNINKSTREHDNNILNSQQ